MATYAELIAQANELTKQAEALRLVEMHSAIKQIREIMETYGITFEELNPTGGKSRSSSVKSKAEPKFRGPNGETWGGGKGRRPAWVLKVQADGGDLESYRI
jgi:DNA-binding protein H-NS